MTTARLFRAATHRMIHIGRIGYENNVELRIQMCDLIASQAPASFAFRRATGATISGPARRLAFARIPPAMRLAEQCCGQAKEQPTQPTRCRRRSLMGGENGFTPS